MDGDELTIGGHTLRTVGVGSSDVPSSSVVHVPELATVISGDVAYNNMHMWLAGSTSASRAGWLAALDRIDTLAATTIITGHKDPASPVGSSPAALIAAMLARYLDLGNPYTLWVAAHDQPELVGAAEPA